MGIVEAKIRAENMERTLSRFPPNWKAVDNLGSCVAALIIFGWDSLCFTVNVVHTSAQLIVVSMEEITTKKLFFLSIVYGGNSTVQRRELWSEMRYIHGIIGSQVWIQLGDFNIVRSAIERSDGFDVLASTEFNDCLFDIEMDDMLMKGLWFTW